MTASRDERGFVLLGVLCLMLLLAVTAVTLNRQAGLRTEMAANQSRAVQGYLGQVAAVEQAVWSLMQDPTWRTSPSGESYDFGGITYNRTVLETGRIGCARIITISVSPPGGGRPIEASLLWHAEALYIADTDNHRVRMVDPATGFIETVAGTGVRGYNGDGIPATSARLNCPNGAWLDSDCNLFFADTDNNRVRRVDVATGLIETVAGTGGMAGYSGDGGPAIGARLNRPRGVSLGVFGDIYIADTDNNRVRWVDSSTGIIDTVAGTGASGYNGDGIPAVNAELDKPEDVSTDLLGNVYIADTGNHRVRRVDVATGLIETVAGTGASGYNGDGIPAVNAEINKPRGIYVDASGNIYIADTDNHRVRRVDVATGLIETVAGTGASGYSGDGGPATSAGLDTPEDVYVDSSGNIYIADTNNDCIRRVDAATGLIETVAGTGVSGYSGDGGPATNAKLRTPRSVGINPPGAATSLERL